VRIIYVHGLGGEGGGKLETAVQDAARTAGHEFEVLRWGSGDFNKDAGDIASQVLKEFTTDLLWAPVRSVATLAREATGKWERALAATPDASLALSNRMRQLDKKRERFTAIGYSLGGRVMLMALSRIGKPPSRMHRAVFTGAAVSVDAFATIGRVRSKPGRVVNVYSLSDDVLKIPAWVVHGLNDPAGRNPIEFDGIENVEVDAGHLGYDKLSDKLVCLATVRYHPGPLWKFRALFGRRKTVSQFGEGWQ